MQRKYQLPSGNQDIDFYRQWNILFCTIKAQTHKLFSPFHFFILSNLRKIFFWSVVCTLFAQILQNSLRITLSILDINFKKFSDFIIRLTKGGLSAHFFVLSFLFAVPSFAMPFAYFVAQQWSYFPPNFIISGSLNFVLYRWKIYRNIS